MKAMLIQQLMAILLGMLSPEVMKKGVDALLDVVEDSVENSKTGMDDIIVLPLAATIRKTFDIPDND